MGGRRDWIWRQVLALCSKVARAVHVMGEWGTVKEREAVGERGCVKDKGFVIEKSLE